MRFQSLLATWLIAMFVSQVSAAEGDAYGLVIRVSGSATYIDESGKVVEVSVGTRLTSGALVRTARDGKVTLNFRNAGGIVLQPDSDLKIVKFKRYSAAGEITVEISLHLQKGTLSGEMPTLGKASKIEILTPKAAAALRAFTRFQIFASGIFQCAEGNLYIPTPSQSFNLTNGQALDVTSRPLEIKDLPEADAKVIQAASSPSVGELSASVVVLNAKIHTMATNRPLASAIALAGNRIVAVGSNDDVAKWARLGTLAIDAQGKVVLPGFNDSHVHFINSGIQLTGVELRGAATTAEFAKRIDEFSKELPEGRWITGGDWDHERWPGGPLPTRDLIDPVTPNTPVFVTRLDGHMGLANSVALKLGGVTKSTPDPPGGLIVRDAKTGEPTGILKDAAMSLVSRRIPPTSRAEKMEGAKAATAHAAQLGVTSVQDMSAGADVGVFQELAERYELKTRVYAVSPLPNWERLAVTGVRAGFGSDWLRIGGLKGFSDGSLGSSTAWFFEPYVGASDAFGLPSDELLVKGKNSMLENVRGADRAGLQVMIHAIGNRANDAVLGIYEQVFREGGERDRRFRIEHAQHVRLADIPRFGSLRVIASMQPYHVADDGRWAEKRIAGERLKGTYAFRSLLDSGAVLAFGSDWNVAPLDPMQGIMAAVTRRTLDGKHPEGWIPEQKITVEESVRAYTVGSAYAEFQEGQKGTLSPGMLADFVMLDRDIFRIPPTEIEKVKVVLTIVDGGIVWEKTEN